MRRSVLLGAFLLGALVAAGAFAQSAARPSFEAASIKVFDEPQQSGSINPGPEGLAAHNVSLLFMIQWAWNLKPYEISVPNALQQSLDSPHYDLVARAAESVPLPQLRLMAQTMLVERFHLEVHTDKREIPVFALVVAKDGPRQLNKPAAPDEPPNTEVDRKNTVGGKHWLFHNEPIGAVGVIISNGLERPIVDMTGLSGKFDYTFVLPLWNRSDGPLGDFTIASVFPELQRQLGLRIEARTAPADVLVIDGADRFPTAN